MKRPVACLCSNWHDGFPGLDELEGQEVVHMPTFWAKRCRIPTSEARRLIAQGAQMIEGKRCEDLDVQRERLKQRFSLRESDAQA